MPTWNTAKNILCIRLDTIGDVIMTTPAMRALKRADRQITLMTSSAGAIVAPLIPDLDDLIVYDSPWLKATAPRIDSRPEYEMAELLRSRNFDGAVIFTVYSQNPLPSAFLCYLAGIPLRLAHCHENPYQLLSNWVKDPEPEQFIRHEVRRQLDLVAAMGKARSETIDPLATPTLDAPYVSDRAKLYACRNADEQMRLQVPLGAKQRVLSLLEELNLDVTRPWCVIHPGATAPSRRYPPEQFAVAARSLVQSGIQVIFTGTGSEREVVTFIQTAMETPSHSLVDRLDLSELTALLSLAPILISNNTGPVHIAAAVGTPVVDLYALTNPQHTPWGIPNRVLFHDVPCRNCYKSICPEVHHNCLRLVPPSAIVQAAQELLQETQPPQPVLID